MNDTAICGKAIMYRSFMDYELYTYITFNLFNSPVM